MGWVTSGSNTAVFGVASGTNAIFTGSVVNDFCFRNDSSKGFLFSTDGSTIGFQVVASNGGIKTSTPGGSGAGAWKLGTRISGTYTADLTKAVEIDIGGTLIKLAVLS